MKKFLILAIFTLSFSVLTVNASVANLEKKNKTEIFNIEKETFDVSLNVIEDVNLAFQKTETFFISTENINVSYIEDLVFKENTTSILFKKIDLLAYFGLINKNKVVEEKLININDNYTKSTIINYSNFCKKIKYRDIHKFLVLRQNISDSHFQMSSFLVNSHSKYDFCKNRNLLNSVILLN